MPIKSFRGLLADDGIDMIPLATKNGSMGYRIKKFQLMAQNLGSQEYQNVVKVFTTPQSTATATVDFSDNTLLAAGYYEGNQATTSANENLQVIFDNMTFNQDIYITHKDDDGGQPINYYIELEQIKLDLSENTVATLKDIRNLWTEFNTGL
tara:strand:+ start:114 stop:569 length:456 start_codon:yes stop_codon:yes gene_type:complete